MPRYPSRNQVRRTLKRCQLVDAAGQLQCLPTARVVEVDFVQLPMPRDQLPRMADRRDDLPRVQRCVAGGFQFVVLTRILRTAGDDQVVWSKTVLPPEDGWELPCHACCKHGRR